MLSTLKLPHKNPLGKDQMKKANTILQKLHDSPDSIQFRQPVDWKALGLTDYPIIVKVPMDLSTVKKKLVAGRYKFVQEFLDDIQLIWDNCKLYNAPGSYIYVVAQKLEREFKKNIKNYLPSINVVVPGKGQQKQMHEMEHSEPLAEITHSEKLKLTQRMRLLRQEELGVLIEMIQKRCPEAFRELEQQKGQILIDQLDTQTFEQMNKQINEFQQKRGERE